MMDRKPVRNMVSSTPKNKFDKLVNLFGFIIRIKHFKLSQKAAVALSQIP